MTKCELSLLLYLESRAVDHGGLVDLKFITNDDMNIAESWNVSGYIEFVRLDFESVERLHHSTYAVKLTEKAWEDAHKERRARYERIYKNRRWSTIHTPSERGW